MKKILLLSLCFFLLSCDNFSSVANKPETALEHAEKHLEPNYICPMHPQVIQHKAGNCPICGMVLVQKKTSLDSLNATVSVDEHIVSRMGIRTALVEKKVITKQINTFGVVSYADDNVSEIRSSTYGWVENLAVRRAGLQVKQGQLLMELYSPEYLQAQKDFIKAQKKDKSGISKHYQQRKESVFVRDYLRYLKVSESALNEISRTGKVEHRLAVYSPQFGYLIEFNVHKHQFVEQDTMLFKIADLSTVWVEINVPENQLQWIKRGLKATIKMSAYPEQIWFGRVDYIYPELDSISHSLKVRLTVPNPSGYLKPNMLTKVILHDRPSKTVLTIPTEALIRTGQGESVIVVLDKGMFKAVEVVAGQNSQGYVQIILGLKQGDTVVTSGQFLIDSEANIQAGFKRLSQ